jgi:parvulin-like peptidyl-prolyl isomerase
LNHFGQKEWSILVKDLSAEKRKTLLDDPELRKTQANNIRELLAFACEAERLGLSTETINAGELRAIRSEVIASDYDRKYGTPKGSIPYSSITDARIATFYADNARLAEFDEFLRLKTALLQRTVPEMADRSITNEEREEAKAFFARIKISEKAALLRGEPLLSASSLKARLQQAQFLARLASEAIAAEVTVDSNAVSQYISTHPELDPSAKKIKAEKLLERAKAGENFATLADEFTEDPGNDRDGKKNGGLYSQVSVGVMVPVFEKASLSLSAGQIYPTLVESDFGFHVIKLENKSTDGQSYDVRHILISTAVKDPDDPDGAEQPIATFVRTKLENERERAVIERLVARHAIVIEDYKPPVAVPANRVVRKRRR